MNLKTDSINIENKCEKLLRFELDSKFTFNAHLDGIIKKFSQKFDTYLEFLQLRIQGNNAF